MGNKKSSTIKNQFTTNNISNDSKNYNNIKPIESKITENTNITNNISNDSKNINFTESKITENTNLKAVPKRILNPGKLLKLNKNILNYILEFSKTYEKNLLFNHSKNKNIFLKILSSKLEINDYFRSDPTTLRLKEILIKWRIPYAKHILSLFR